MKSQRTKQKRCYGCKHFLAKTWRHNYCRACRKLERLKTKISKRMSELHKPMLPTPQLSKICETCAKPAPLFTCKKYTLDGKKQRDSVRACAVCCDGFLKRLGYVTA